MTWRGRNIYLVGLPGVGKSSIGEHVAKLLAHFGYEFCDLDRKIESRANSTVGEIFEREGEEAFRDLETHALLAVSRDAFREPQVVATGGGIVLRDLNRTIMRGSGLIVWIDVSVREAARNIARDIEEGKKRPLIGHASDVEARVRELLNERRPYYEEATLHFVYKTGGASDRTPEELAEELMKALGEMSFHVGLKPRFETILARSVLSDYPVLVGNGIAAKEVAASLKGRGVSHAIVVTDSNVAALHLEAFTENVQKEFASSSLRIEQSVITAGEENKTLETLMGIAQSFRDHGASRRNTAILALGGGVVTDIAALAANLYHRGLPVLHIPTTLLAQVDASIGGKTGIDAFGAKNVIGTFYPPAAVFVDPLFLQTLPKRELHSGLAELLKYGLIGNRPLWERLSAAIVRLTRGVDAEYPLLIAEGIREKLRYVEQDEFERLSGVRELLNFGHTFGHALEAATGFRSYLHGEAVLIGMRTAAWLSDRLGSLSPEDHQAIDAVLAQVPIAGGASCSSEVLLQCLMQDKKHSAEPRFVLLRGIGEAYVDSVPQYMIASAIEYMQGLL